MTLPHKEPIRVPVPASLPNWAKAEVLSRVNEIHAGARLTNPTDALNLIRSSLAIGRLQTPVAMLGAFFVSALADLAIQGWQVTTNACEVLLTPPSTDVGGIDAEKRRVRAGHLVGRDRQLSEPAMRSFVASMEETRLYRGQWVSVFSLMRDGRELAQRLAEVSRDGGADALREAIDPYIQIVDTEVTCEHTGLRLSDVWRYFRATWSSAYQSVPGRRMHILIRDGAAAFHPVIGIAALSSAVVQLRVRDDWIGWTPERVFESLAEGVSQADADYFDSLLKEALHDVYRRDFVSEGLLTRSELARPTTTTVARLAGEARRARKAHESYPKATDYKAKSDAPHDVDWEERARSFLFRSKRAATLATLLEARRRLREVGMKGADKEGLKAALRSSSGRKALSVLLRSVKARHVGIDMLDITTCGAIAPYTHILGGKLVSLLMMSPEIVDACRSRYGNAPSLIASAMKGELVVREPRLVLLGTTSLYGVGSSQYNRLRIPAAALGGSARGDLRFEELGRTVGFGSYHFSQQTLGLADRVASQARSGRRVNSIFGEGVNPRLRKLREALAAAGFPTDRVLRHGSPRLVYGVPLAGNFREVLLGRMVRPRYLLRPRRSEDGTQQISRFWRERWLKPRVERPEVLATLAEHTLLRPVRHGARVPIQPEVEGLSLFVAGV